AILLAMLLPVGSLAAQSLPGHTTAAALSYCTGAPDAATRVRAEAVVAPDAQDASERDEASALLIRAGIRIAEANRGAACAKVFDEGQQRFTRTLERQTARVRSNASYDKSAVARIAEVQGQLTAQW